MHKVLFIGILIALGGRVDAQAPVVTSHRSAAGDLLRKWVIEGSAAGLEGDVYDNRDRTHSEFDIRPFPQLKKHAYTEAERKANADWAAQQRLLPQVTFGNSSTAAYIVSGGSNSRRYYSHPNGLTFLYQQYTHNNLYIYPEHQDHDPGHNGPSGWGDVFPTNTPYLITSQGSSGSDQVFLRAVAFTLGSFRPEVKKKLVETGLLMPTIQQVFRSSNKPVAKVEDYLRPQAHPTVFEGANVDELRMMTLAHSIKLDDIPPMVQLKMTKEEELIPGRDFFEPGGSEKLADSPCAISRIFRGTKYQRTMQVSAEGSFDVNKRPLTYHWVVLRGDEKRISIKPLNESKSAAEITIAWHERRPVTPGSPLESNRVDIGVFAHNGAYYSAPGFVTWHFPDNEAREYSADGRLIEIGYGMGEAFLTVADWGKWFDALKADPPASGIALLKASLPEKEWALVLSSGLDYAGAAKKPGDVNKAKNDVLNARPAPIGKSVREIVDGKLTEMSRNAMFYTQHADQIEMAAMGTDARRAILRNGKARLQAFGVPDLTPAGIAGLNRYQQAMVQRFNADVLGRILFDGLIYASLRTNYVDPELASPKVWRDIYQYDKAGHWLGFKRYDDRGSYDFSTFGALALKRDALGRCIVGRQARYERQAGPPGQPAYPDWREVRHAAQGEDIGYKYAGDNDFAGMKE